MTAVIAATVRPSYPTEEAALKRAEQLKRSGMWPGVIRVADDRWQLTAGPGGVPVRKRPRGMWLDSAAHILYTPTMHGKQIAVARWHHHIHLIPGWLFEFICDRFEASLWRGLPPDYCPHVTYSSLPGLTCGCGLPIANNITTTAAGWGAS